MTDVGNCGVGGQVPFFLVTGFLGSGKTTLLRHFLDTWADTRRLAVIQNEFAPGNVDGAELRRTGKPFHLVELNRGSVFCVCLLGDFIWSLRELVDKVRPDAVILEATGLADPIALAQVLESPELRDRVVLAHAWCVVDTPRFLVWEKQVGQVGRQVRIADTVLLNKTDAATPVEIAAAAGRIRELNPMAAQIQTSFCRVALDNAFAALAHASVAQVRAKENAAMPVIPRPLLHSVALRSTRRLTRTQLDAWLSELTPQVHRLKGFVLLADGSAVSVQSSFGALQIVPVTDYSPPTELVAIGPGLDARAFRAAFEQLATGDGALNVDV